MYFLNLRRFGALTQICCQLHFEMVPILDPLVAKVNEFFGKAGSAWPRLHIAN